ncbi:MAG: DNRLRE domain-containing protein [Planctomycetes bacterium]|nr:DNRLRE domain-containing protein [Planctomycetota bacterium]
MTKHFLQSLHQSLFPNAGKARKPRRRRVYRRSLAMESLESRQMLSATPLANLSVSQNTGEKPQSKVFEYAGQWWTVMPNSTGTWVFRLDGTNWTPTQQITTNKSVHADVKLVDDVAHVLLYNGANSQLASLQYDAGPDNRFEPWSLRPQLVNVGLSSGSETATLDIDSTGRMWIAYDPGNRVEVRYSDGLYTSWSAPITVESGISSDDISAIIAMPNNTIGVMWSNQNTKKFGFKTHQDGAEANAWSALEIPAMQWVTSVGGSFADDHIHLAATSDGTLYAAVKTSYDSSGKPEIMLLVRRPNGTWDNAYTVDGKGTRPIVVVNEAAGKLIVAYSPSDSGGSTVYRESPLGNISFGAKQVLIQGSNNNVTSTKYTSSNEIVFLAGSSSTARGVRFSFDTGAPPVVNLPPVVNAGSDRSTELGTPVAIDGTVSDDGQPAPASLTTLWTKLSGPGTVTFGNANAVDTTAIFDAVGTYVLRLTASDGLRSTVDDVTITVAAPPPQPGTDPPPSGTPTQIAFQDGLFPYVSYAGTSDTKIAGGNATTNYGTATTFDVDGDPDIAALLKWDVSAIPAGSIVVSAAIELYVTNSTKQNFEVYALQKAWDELSATWQRLATGNNWSGAGATGGSDHDSTALGQLGPGGTGIQRIELNAAGLAAVQSWIDDSQSNFGIILQDYSASDGVDFYSSEYATVARRPKLVVNYETPPLVVAHGAGGSQQSGTSSNLPNTPGIQWELMKEFSDEFNGTTLDEAKWDTVYKNWTGQDPGMFDSSSVSVADGYLQLDVNLPPAGTLPPNKQYTTASVNTTGGDLGSLPREVLYGYFELRAKSMNAKTTSAFWLFNNTPENWTEIDAMELVYSMERSVPTNLHVIRENGVTVSEQFPAILTFDDANVPSGETHFNSFHTYGLDWNVNTIDWYIDGALVRSVPNDRWHQPLYLNITNSIQDFNGLPTGNELSAAAPFLVDYVRVYKAVPESV